MESKTALTEAYGQALLELARQDERVVAVDADVAKRMGSKLLGAEFPNRHINVGVAEQNMIGVAAGLAAVGLVPFAGTFAVFSTGRCYDQLRQVAAYPRLNVKVIGAHGGISVGEDGATHQAMEDISLVRTLPNFTVLVPCDPVEVKKATALALEIDGPVYIRLARPYVPVILPEDYRLELGKAAVLREGGDVTLAACGIMVHKALEAAATLAEEGISARVLNMSSIKPLDRDAVAAAARETAGIVTVEDHSVIGGLGSAVAEVLAEEGCGRLRRIGVQDCFGESGDGQDLLAKYGLEAADIVAKARELCQGRTVK